MPRHNPAFARDELGHLTGETLTEQPLAKFKLAPAAQIAPEHPAIADTLAAVQREDSWSERHRELVRVDAQIARDRQEATNSAFGHAAAASLIISWIADGTITIDDLREAHGPFVEDCNIIRAGDGTLHDRLREVSARFHARLNDKYGAIPNDDQTIHRQVELHRHAATLGI